MYNVYKITKYRPGKGAITCEFHRIPSLTNEGKIVPNTWWSYLIIKYLSDDLIPNDSEGMQWNAE